MANATRGRRPGSGLLLAAVLALAIVWGRPVSAQQAGTTLTANKTATGHLTQAFGWSIAKSVSPDTLNLLQTETGTAQYTITVGKQAASAEAAVEGQICVTKGGSAATEKLQIADVVHA